MITLELPFNQELYLQQTKITFRYVYEKDYLKIRRSVIFTTVSILIGIILLLFRSELSTLFFAIAVYGIMIIHGRQEHYQRLKDGHLREIRKLLTLPEFEFSASLILTEKALRVHYENHCSFTYWSDFEELKRKKEHLILIPMENKENTMVISKSEVTSISFDKLYSFLREKIEN